MAAAVRRVRDRFGERRCLEKENAACAAAPEAFGERSLSIGRGALHDTISQTKGLRGRKSFLLTRSGLPR